VCITSTARHVHRSPGMANPGDYNPFIESEHLVNDRKQARITLIGLAFAAVLAVALIIALVK
jgi:hypothetical protein